MVKISAIVVTYNGAKWVDKCFGSLVNSSIPIKILAIDNGSTDGTTNLIREKFPQVEVIETGTNLGFGKANNIGLKRVLEEKADYAFLLNQDAWVEKDTVEQLIKTHQCNPDFGVLAPLQLNGDGTEFDKLFFQYTLAPCQDYFFDYLVKKKKPELIITIPFANGACWLLPYNTLAVNGGFDPLFTHYGEDDDYINRLKTKKLKVGLVTNVKVYHDRETRNSNKDNKDFKKLVNHFFIRNLTELKNPENKSYNKTYYYKKIIFALLLSLFAVNKKFYKAQTKGILLLLKYYQTAIEHRKIENLKGPHYLEDLNYLSKGNSNTLKGRPVSPTPLYTQ